MYRVAAFCVLAVFSAHGAQADCLKTEDFGSSEQTAYLKAGDEWRLTVDEEGGDRYIVFEYRDTYGEPLRWATAQWGVYPAFEEQHLSVDPAAGVSTPWPAKEWFKRFRFDSPPPEPVAGGDWTSTGRAELEIDGQNNIYAVTATYSFDPEKTVSLSGCSYRSIGVNGTFDAGDVKWSARWVYFPDLKVGVQTKANDSRTGENWSNGMIGLGG